MSEMQLPPLPRSLTINRETTKAVNDSLVMRKSYSISSTRIKYNLPTIEALQPGIDTRPGDLDTWPARAQGPHPPVIGAEKPTKNVEFLPKGNYKPKFLDQLENFLQKELKALDSLENNPSEKRLQAFREVFERLIEDFKTYRPLLSSIKNEYEMMIIHQREKIRELEPLKSMLVTVSEQCEKTLLAMKEEEKVDLQAMKFENERLHGVISSLKDNELTLNAQVTKLQDELAKEYLKYRNECDARKMLIVEINDIRAQSEDATRTSMLETESIDGKKDDPTFLRIALKKAREDIELKNDKLAQMEADYGDVIPRRDYEKLNNRLNMLEKELEEVGKREEVLMKEHSVLLDIHDKTEKERKEYVKECETMRRCATPRPRWEKCGQYIEGGEERWKLLSRDKSSDVMVDVLLAEITGTDISIIQAGTGANDEFFEGLGTGNNIPKYLRYDGQFRNRRIAKRDALLLIKDVWQARISSGVELTDSDYESLPSFLHAYLERRFGAENMTSEWAYNLHDACVRYKHDPRISLFMGILTDEIDEAIYHDQRARHEKLSNSLMTLDPGDSDDWSVPKDVFLSCVHRCFPSFNEQAIEELMALADEYVKDDRVLYKDILKEDDEGAMTLFVDKMNDFDRKERIAYVQELEDNLPAKSDIKENELRDVFINLDPQLPPSYLDHYISRVFTESNTKTDDTVDRETIIMRLRNSNLGGLMDTWIVIEAKT